MTAAIFWAFAGAVAGAYATLGILAIGDRVAQRRERLARERACAEAERAAGERKRLAMLRAIRALNDAGGSSYQNHIAAMNSLQAAGDHEAAGMVYVLFQAESEFTGNTWTAVEELEAA